jgi:hypothetical protein
MKIVRGRTVRTGWIFIESLSNGDEESMERRDACPCPVNWPEGSKPTLEDHMPTNLNAPADAGSDTTRESYESPPTPTPRSRLHVVWSATCAALGAVLGLIPHVAHHAGLLLGAAAITGAAGNAALAALGLVLSIPLLRRLHRRFGTWRAPAIAVALFSSMFALSAFVIGPAIAGQGPANPAPPTAVVPTVPSPIPSASNHEGHHSDRRG